MGKTLAWDSKKKVAQSGQTYVRDKSDSLYHTHRWTRLSRSWRMTHPLCEECRRAGIIKEAEVVDHITPWPICGRDGFFDESNLQSLCESCNHAKGQRDKARIQEWKREHTHAGGRGVEISRGLSRKTTPPLFFAQCQNSENLKTPKK